MTKKMAATAEQEESIKTELEDREVFHKFTEEDLNIINEKIAELTEKKEKFSDEQKTVAAIVKGTDGEIKKALKAKAEGGEERHLMCPVIINSTKGTRTVKHPETGDIIEERNLTPDERQQELFPAKDAADTLAKAEEMQDGAEDLLDEAHAEEE